MGVPIGLHFVKGSYGPFDPELKKLLSKFVNNGLLIQEQLGRMLSLRVGPTYKDAYAHYEDELLKYKNIVDQITNLFLRMRTNDAELAATVYFVTLEILKQKNGKTEEKDVLRKVMEWKINRRPPLKEEEVGYTIRNLAMLGWLKVQASQDLALPKEAF